MDLLDHFILKFGLAPKLSSSSQRTWTANLNAECVRLPIRHRVEMVHVDFR
jgi:hypothetical protein